MLPERRKAALVSRGAHATPEVRGAITSLHRVGQELTLRGAGLDLVDGVTVRPAPCGELCGGVRWTPKPRVSYLA